MSGSDGKTESVFHEDRFPTEQEALEREASTLTPEELVESSSYRLGVRFVDWILNHSWILLATIVSGVALEILLLLAFPSSQAAMSLAAFLAVLLAFLFGCYFSALALAGSLRLATERICGLTGNHAERLGFVVPEPSDAAPQATGIRRVDTFCALIETVLDMPLSKSEEIVENYHALRDRYELVTTNIAASVIIYDEEGQVVLCSPYTQVLTGYSSEEIESAQDSGVDFMESIVVPEDLERYRRARKVSTLGEDILVRCRINHRSGLLLWLETRMVPVVDKDGEVESVMNVAIDVTDSLTYQEQIEEQNQDLSDFAYMVSHDLKAPIFTIKGMASALMEDHGAALGKDGEELIEYIVDGAKRLEQLVASVIEYSSVATKEGKRGEVDLGKVIDDVRADLQESIRQKKAVVQIADSELPTILGDRIRLYQVFSNLIGNALKYSSPERSPEIILSARRPSSNTLVIDVRDNGMGIPADRIDDIFRPYHRAHGKEIEGSGIGLACVKKIVERVGGSVSVKSTLGEGSTFSVSFSAPEGDPREVPEDLARLF